MATGIDAKAQLASDALAQANITSKIARWTETRSQRQVGLIQPLSRHGDQDLRVVVSHPVYPETDGTPFEGAGIRFAHQIQKQTRRRSRIEPVGKLRGINDRRLPVVGCHTALGRPRW